MQIITKISTGKMAIWYLSCNHILSLLSYNLKEAILESTAVSMVFKQGGLLEIFSKNTSKEQHQKSHMTITGGI